MASATQGAEQSAGRFTGTMRAVRSAGQPGPMSGRVGVARAVGGGFSRLDRVTMARLSALPTPSAAVTGARLVSGLAEPKAVSAALAVAALSAIGRRDWQASCLAVLAVGTGAATRRWLSRIIARPRPPAERWLTEPEGFSLPSKHTTLAVLAAGACVRSTGASGPARHLVPFLAAASVGASRVYLGVHWPTDILAGWLFGEGWLWLTSVPVRAGHGRSGLASPSCHTPHQAT